MKKTVKAWLVEPPFSGMLKTYDFIYSTERKAVRVASKMDVRVIPCVITYEVPKRRKP